MRWKTAAVSAAAALAMMVPSTSHAVHWYRGPGGGCTPADGELTADAGTGTVTATVAALHNSFNDLSNGTPVTRIKAGEAVRWQWWSSHCHSAQSDGIFNSGFHYPTAAPETPRAVAGLFEYPVPDSTPTLSYVRTFNAPGIYRYFCIHHVTIGMAGVVVVE